MSILMGKGLAVFWKIFLLLQSFWVKNAKIEFFKEKNGFERSFYNIEVWVVTNWSTRLENTKQLNFCLW